MTQDFRDLRVWQSSMELVEAVYGLTRSFPADERFGLTAQIRRAAVSVPSCIAEGNVQGSTRAYLRLLSIAAGSLAEVETQLRISVRVGFVAQSAADPLLDLALSTRRLLQALRASLNSRVAEESTPFPIPHSPFPA